MITRRRLDPEKVRKALEESWSAKTSAIFNPEIAPVSYGQCAQTAIVIFENFGGEILRTEVEKCEGDPTVHFYNRIDGQLYDFTADQFSASNNWKELIHHDFPSSKEEAMEILMDGQLEEMRRAFNAALSKRDDA